MLRTRVNRTLSPALLALSTCLVSACAGDVAPGPVDHSPFDLPSETGTVGLYLRNCLAPSTGLVTGSDAPARIDGAGVLTIIECAPDTGREAVRVSRATGDVRPLLAALASRPPAFATSTGKKTVLVIFTQGDQKAYVTVSGVPAAALDAATFVLVGTTPSGSL